MSIDELRFKLNKEGISEEFKEKLESSRRRVRK